jgi:hypothetical protein
MFLPAGMTWSKYLNAIAVANFLVEGAGISFPLVSYFVFENPLISPLAPRRSITPPLLTPTKAKRTLP